MKKFWIKIEKKTEIAEKILNRYQLFLFKRSQSMLLNLIKNSNIRKYKANDTADTSLYIEEGENKYIDKERKEFESFIFGDYEKIKKINDKEWNMVYHDRIVYRMNKAAKRFKENIKYKTIKKVLGDNSIIGFLSRMGIFVTWDTEEITKNLNTSALKDS